MPRPSTPHGARRNPTVWCPRGMPRLPARRPAPPPSRDAAAVAPRRSARRRSLRSALAMRFPVLHRLLVVMALVAMASPAHAKKKEEPPKDAAKPAAAAPGAGGAGGAGAPGDKPLAEWCKFTKDAEQKKGCFTTWKKRDNLYLEIAPDQMEKPFLYVVSLAKGIGSNFVLGGLPLDDRMLQFERHGDRVFLVQVNTWLTAPKDTPIGKARDLSIPNSIVQTFKIESENEQSKAVLIDVGTLLLSDLTDLSEGLKGAFNNVAVRFDKDRSSLGALKTFPDNSEFEVTLTYSPLDRSHLQLDAVPDNRYIPLGVHYSFTRLPEHPMQPRYADNRVGFF